MIHNIQWKNQHINIENRNSIQYVDDDLKKFGF